MFIREHNYMNNEVMKVRSTKIGSVFTTFLILFSVLVIVISILNYIYDNFIETKSLVPIVSLQSVRE